MEVSIIGTGNLAWHLAKAFEKVNVKVAEIYARDIRKAEDLSSILYDAEPTDSLDFSASASQIFFICVSDNAISNVAAQIIVPQKAIVVHTSGAKPLSLLEKIPNAETGVFYPLQTFSRNVPMDFSSTPVCLEASSENTFKTLKNLASKLSENVKSVNSQERLIYHIGAVFSCNFVNHLWAISKEILESENLDFEMLKPIILETTHKMLDSHHPAEVQTGPAVRNDSETINSHLNFLSDDEDLYKVYTTLTESISDWHSLDS